ncbi:MAG: hypothetical protein VYB89_05105 [Pseudomonadota bacterium]|nr:hypothetical protein [Pseudomonadota bacterium]
MAFRRLWVDDGGNGDFRPVWDFWGTDLALADAVLGDLRRRALAVFSRGVGIDLDRSVLAAVVAFVVGANLVVAAIIVATVWSLEGWLLPARRAALSLVEIYFYALTIGLAVSAVVTPIRQRQTMAAMVVDRPDGG